MTRSGLLVSTLAALAAALGGCAYNQTTTTSEARIVPQVHAYRPGTGVVQAVMRAPAVMGAAAAAGASTAAGGNRLEIRMDGGGIQYIDTDATEFNVGNRVELTADHLIRKI